MEQDLSSFSIDINDLRRRLERLHNISTKSLRHLSDSELCDFSNVTKHISSLYGTDGYTHLYKEIIDYFPISTDVVPGTIGGYFVGCSASNNFKYGSECALTCLTGAPTHQDNGECGKCSKSVYLAPFDNGYSFTQLALGDSDPATAIIYITPPFIGFTDNELSELESKGVKNVIISFYNEEAKEYSISNVTPCGAVPRRNDATQDIGFKTITTSGKNVSAITDIEQEIEAKLAGYKDISTNGCSSSSMVIQVIFLLLLLSALGFIVWQSIKSNYNYSL